MLLLVAVVEHAVGNLAVDQAAFDSNVRNIVVVAVACSIAVVRNIAVVVAFARLNNPPVERRDDEVDHRIDWHWQPHDSYLDGVVHVPNNTFVVVVVAFLYLCATENSRICQRRLLSCVRQVGVLVDCLVAVVVSEDRSPLKGQLPSEELELAPRNLPQFHPVKMFRSPCLNKSRTYCFYFLFRLSATGSPLLDRSAKVKRSNREIFARQEVLADKDNDSSFTTKRTPGRKRRGVFQP